jgi:hypothetical protein
MRKITIIIGLAAMLGGCVVFPVPLPSARARQHATGT